MYKTYITETDSLADGDTVGYDDGGDSWVNSEPIGTVVHHRS